MITLTQARDLLREELLAVAAAAVPGHNGVVTHDAGPVNPRVLEDGSGPATVCLITVENGDPAVVDPRGQVAAAVAALTERGWQAEVQPVESGHHRASANRDGFGIVVHGWDGEWRLTLSGQTPEITGQPQ
ncbi:hypothetical protein ACQPXM_40225 [Kribbella sp. CA-253562]|uniref:hypothetical protein n=1 Tax=Kribbella sp. CA-253562 TaxID=3239942 RepID=UPI003D8A9463